MPREEQNAESFGSVKGATGLSWPSVIHVLSVSGMLASAAVTLPVHVPQFESGHSAWYCSFVEQVRKPVVCASRIPVAGWLSLNGALQAQALVRLLAKPNHLIPII